MKVNPKDVFQKFEGIEGELSPAAWEKCANKLLADCTGRGLVPLEFRFHAAPYAQNNGLMLRAVKEEIFCKLS